MFIHIGRSYIKSIRWLEAVHKSDYASGQRLIQYSQTNWLQPPYAPSPQL